MANLEQNIYKITENEIIKISRLMASVEEAIKELIRKPVDDYDFKELRFYELRSNYLRELYADQDL
jgi:DNA repair exonuclease SbcCD ATPase subunit